MKKFNSLEEAFKNLKKGDLILYQPENGNRYIDVILKVELRDYKGCCPEMRIVSFPIFWRSGVFPNKWTIGEDHIWFIYKLS